jgi:acyl CoA:acetate/3-ketoacid CoA transferase alpha subunit
MQLFGLKKTILIKKKITFKLLEGLENGMTIMLGGFGLCGIPENSIAELVKEDRSDLYIK